MSITKEMKSKKPLRANGWFLYLKSAPANRALATSSYLKPSSHLYLLDYNKNNPGW